MGQQTFIINTFMCPNPGTAWTVDDKGCTLPASQTTEKCWMPFDGKIGDEVVSYKLVGDGTEAAALTLDCKFVRVNKADPLTTTDPAGGAIVQVTADGNFDVEATLAAVETIATDKGYRLELLGTTGAGDSITVTAAELVVNCKGG